MNWDLIGTVAFFAGVLFGVAVIVGELIAGFNARDSVMEGRDDVAPVGVPEPLPVLRDIPNPERWPKPWAYRAAVGAEETMDIRADDLEMTTALELWERPPTPGTYRGGLR